MSKLESLLLDKNKKMELELTQLKVKISEKIITLETAEVKIAESTVKVNEQQRLIAKVEDDILKDYSSTERKGSAINDWDLQEMGTSDISEVHGGLTFLNLRDQSGIVQITMLPDEYPEAYAIANKLRVEYVVAVEGTIWARPSESVNKMMKTGDIEMMRVISLQRRFA